MDRLDQNNALMAQSTVWASLLDARQLPLGPVQRIVTPGTVRSGPPNGTGAGLTRGAIARISQAQDGCLFPIEMKRAQTEVRCGLRRRNSRKWTGMGTNSETEQRSIRWL